ncbi:thiaminase II [Staphylococcus massiliensis]|uniref:Aminopyrimidine aminohydrolase n=1 Tax=Staphylococcus massiliensis S46 TaxID=1229783 RepID=K9AIM1_9STAP|nr:thiaminase II [Staphylococcus massiliensis]EKU47149.1 putative thiaminase II [Staphylococcus massiliensis S46]MCG3402722.1 thiaminase II [Staphylococcus massiliensis]POA01890.1 thiaminase II [Staphylococcus massiliensis CCUG 55927]
MSFAKELKEKAEPIVEAIYKDPFIQKMIEGELDKEAVKHYLQADSRYLNEFAKIYALLIPKVDSKEEIQFLTEQINFASSGEVDAHITLAEYVGESYESIIEKGEWFPTADHYIKHMYYNAYAFDNVAYTITAMAPCPYVYQQVGKRAMKDHQFSDDNPFKKWFEFYDTEMDPLIEQIDSWLDERTQNMTDEEKQVLEKNFLQSANHERRFFNMAYNKEEWNYGG